MIIPEKTQQMFKQHGFKWDEMTFPGSAETENYEKFMKLVEREKQPVKTEIHSVYRLEYEGKEFIFYHATVRSRTRLGKKLEASMSHVGMDWIPNFEKVYQRQDDDPTNDIERWELDDGHYEYTIPWTKENIAKLAKNFHDKTNFYFKDELFRFRITKDEFENAPRNDLIKIYTKAHIEIVRKAYSNEVLK